MLIAGRWCSTAARWTVQVAEGLQAAPGPTASSSTAPGGYGGQAERPAAVVEEAAAARHDATCALLLVRAAVAALALAADVGFEAAVRYLSQEYYRVAAMVRLACPAGVPCCAVLCCAVLCCAVLCGVLEYTTGRLLFAHSHHHHHHHHHHSSTAWFPGAAAAELPLALALRCACLQLVEAMRRGGGMPLSTALLQRLAQEVEAADVLTGACRWAGHERRRSRAVPSGLCLMRSGMCRRRRWAAGFLAGMLSHPACCTTHSTICMLHVHCATSHNASTRPHLAACAAPAPACCRGTPSLRPCGTSCWSTAAPTPSTASSSAARGRPCARWPASSPTPQTFSLWRQAGPCWLKGTAHCRRGGG